MVLIAYHIYVAFALYDFAGVKADGSLKIRPIDDMGASCINAATTAHEKLEYDTLDKYFSMMQKFMKTVGVRFSLSHSCVHCVRLGTGTICSLQS